MTRKQATVRNSAGIHCRPSAVIVREAMAYAGESWVECDAGKANLRSILELVALGLTQGTRVKVSVEGPDERAFCNRLARLFEHHFDFAEVSQSAKSKAVSALMDPPQEAGAPLR
jgi:phosphotransferase system HPr (HPr) family protein